MRLINTQTLLLEDFFGREIPPYAILSHTWGRDEVTLQDFRAEHARHQKKEQPKRTGIFKRMWSDQESTSLPKNGWAKIEGFCKRAWLDWGLTYGWIDTCCIDKSSSAELSEAINSMFRWYQNSVVCYAYLSDVAYLDGLDEEASFQMLRRSRWFSRGWTLQELLAPKDVLFFDKDWRCVGKKEIDDRDITLIFEGSKRWPEIMKNDTTGIPSMVCLIARITGIDVDCLKNPANVFTRSIATRMSWAAKRCTTRQEDEAYCLLGIFGINMPLLYGEGSRAFTRLQEELIKETEDETILSWGFGFAGCDGLPGGVLANTPAPFQHCGTIVKIDITTITSALGLQDWKKTPSVMTSRGLHIDLPCIDISPNGGMMYGVLQAGYYDHVGLETVSLMVLLLPLSTGTNTTLRRVALSTPVILSLQSLRGFSSSSQTKALYLERFGPSANRWEMSSSLWTDFRVTFRSSNTWIDFSQLHDRGFALVEWFPPNVISRFQDHMGIEKYLISQQRLCCDDFSMALFRFEQPGRGSICLYASKRALKPTRAISSTSKQSLNSRAAFTRIVHISWATFGNSTLMTDLNRRELDWEHTGVTVAGEIITASIHAIPRETWDSAPGELVQIGPHGCTGPTEDILAWWKCACGEFAKQISADLVGG